MSVTVNGDNNQLDRRPGELALSRHEFKRRKCKRLELLLTIPSYTLTIGSCNIRRKNRIRLWYLLHRLVSRQNWVEASGVLSVLLKGTLHERSPLFKDHSLRNNRMKFSVAMELRRHMPKYHVERNPEAYSKKIDDLFRLWILNIRSYKNVPFKDRYIMLDHVLSSIARNKHLLADGQSVAHDALKSLKLTSDSGRDPLSYLVVGLASYEVWYHGLLKMINQKGLDDLCIPLQSETVGRSSSRMLDDLREEDAASVNETCSNLQYHSETSVAHDKGAHIDFNQNLNGETLRANANSNLEHNHQFQLRNFDLKSAEAEDTDDNTGDRPDQFQYTSAINLHGVQTLLPLNVPLPEGLLNSNSYNQEYYLNALKYLKLALEAPPPASAAALLPLTQLLFLGGKIKEAFDAVERLCKESDSVLPSRLRARLQECINVDDYDILSSVFEDVMKKDPTCKHSLTRLIDLHQRGEYGHERLVEMLALHLEATYGNHATWKEFASCLLRLSHCEEDRVSTCVNLEQETNEKRRTIRSSRVPAMFVDGMSGKSWKLRCKWWLNRHFSRHSMKSETLKGDWNLMAYKAASASHLYGKDFEYVVKVYECVKEHDNSLISFLRTHIENSPGFFPYLVKRGNSGTCH